MLTIIMSVKRRHLQDMKRGIKRYELRKTLPRMTDGRPCLVLLCESGSGGWLAGEFMTDGFVNLTHADPMTVARLGHISMAEAERYQKKGRGRLYGWKVKDFRSYPVKDRPIHINDIGLNRPPQSWQYVRIPYAGLTID